MWLLQQLLKPLPKGPRQAQRASAAARLPADDQRGMPTRCPGYSQGSDGPWGGTPPLRYFHGA